MNATWNACSVPDSLVKTKVGKKHQILAKDIAEQGKFPVVDQGQSFIAGYCDKAERLIDFDLPVVIFGDHTRCFKYVDFPFILGADGTKVLKPNKDLFDPKFYYFAMLALDIPSRGYNRHFKYLKEQSLPKPPMDEQKKIAYVLSTAQRAIEEQERIIVTTTELKKALMQKLFTEGLCGEPQKQTEIGPIPESWEVVHLGELLAITQYGMSVKGDPDGKYPMLRMTNQVNGRIVANDLQFVDIGYSDFQKFKVRRGDILFNRTNSLDLVGRTAIYDIDGDCVFASYLIRLRTNEERLSPYFLNLDFNRYETQVRLKSIATRAVSQSNISATRLKGFLIPLPSISEQEEIVRYSAAFDAKIELAQTKLSALQSLFRTMLHELVTAKVRVPAEWGE